MIDWSIFWVYFTMLLPYYCKTNSFPVPHSDEEWQIVTYPSFNDTLINMLEDLVVVVGVMLHRSMGNMTRVDFAFLCFGFLLVLRRAMRAWGLVDMGMGIYAYGRWDMWAWEACEGRIAWGSSTKLFHIHKCNALGWHKSKLVLLHIRLRGAKTHPCLY